MKIKQLFFFGGIILSLQFFSQDNKNTIKFIEARASARAEKKDVFATIEFLKNDRCLFTQHGPRA